MSDLTAEQLETLWLEAGGASDLAPTMGAIALAESGGSTDAIHNTAYPDKPNYRPPTPPNLPEYSIGPWQINIYAHTQWTEAEMLDPAQNAKAAVELEGNKAGLGNWSTFTDGAYKTYFQTALAAEPAAERVALQRVKPKVSPPVISFSGKVESATAIPASVTAAPRGLWWSLGTHLPNSINRNIAARKALLRMR